jgi:hypothetical protein
VEHVGRIRCGIVTFTRRGFRLWLLAFIGFWLLHAGWAFATPYNGPPDEQQHVLRAAGIMQGEIVAERDQHTVPKSLIRGWCFPTRVTVPASCEVEPGGDESLQRRVPTTAARFDPVYYLVTSWPVGIWPNWWGLMLSRLINGALMAALLACAVVGAARWTRHRALVAGLVVAITPMTAHLGGAVNPNGIEITAGIALFVSLLALVHEQRDGINRAALALAGVSGATIVTPRFTGLLWLFVIVGVILVPSRRSRLRVLMRSRLVWLWSGIVALASLAALAWTMLAGTASAVSANYGLTMGSILKESVLTMWPNLANQMVGVTGWAETLMPRLVYLAWFAAVGLLVLSGLVLGTRADRWRLLLLFAGTFVPLIAMEILNANRIGWFNQGRYFLTGAVGLPMIGAYVMARRGLTATDLRAMTRLLAIILVPLQLVCLAYSMARWRSGLVSINPFNGSWTPPYGVVIPLLCGTLAVAVLLLTFWLASRIPVPAPPSAAPEEETISVAVPEPAGVSHV